MPRFPTLHSLLPIQMLEDARFLHQFAALLNAGISVQQSLGMAGKGCRAKLQRLLAETSIRIEAGQDLATALSDRTMQLTRSDQWMIALIRTSEYSGTLAEICERLAIAVETESKRVRLYRSVLLNGGLVCLGLVTLLGFCLPKGAIVWLGAGLVVVAILFWGQMTRDGTGITLYQIMAKLPVLQRIAQARSLLYLTEMELPLRAGVSVLQALELIRPRIPDLALRQSLAIAARQIQAGQTLSQSLHGKLPPLALQMLRTGEETGNLDDMLGKLANYYESDLERQLTQLQATLRPLAIVAGGGLVLLVGIQAIRSMLGALPG